MGQDPMYYRLESLILAIDFFTQRFSQEQLMEFSFEFSNEILTLGASALFIRQDNQYVLSKKRLYECSEYTIPHSEQLDHLVTHHGTCLWSNFDQYLDEQTVYDFNIGMLIPLMVDSHLCGFIISSGKSMEVIGHDDKILAGTLMRLFNNSIENSKRFMDLQRSNALLDQKIFNLFTINQSSKALLSEVSLSRLHALATDVFSEISTSQVTSFGLYDPHTGKIKIVGYRNVHTFAALYTEIELTGTTYDGQVVLHVKRDAALIAEYFRNGEQFERLEAEYIVLIVGNRQIVGLVTLGASVQERFFDESLFELIESLATSTYIAVNNSMLFEELEREKRNAQNKLEMLTNLNKLTKNIKHCTTLEDLSYLTLKTMKFAFGIRKAFIGYRRGDRMEIVDSIGMSSAPDPLNIPDKMLSACDGGETCYGFSAKDLPELCGEPLPDAWGESNGFVLSPMSAGDRRPDAADELQGILVVLETGQQLKEEEILLIESIASSISPVAYHIQEAADLKRLYIIDPLQQLHTALSARISDYHNDGVEFYVYWGQPAKHPFQALQLPAELEQLETYYMDGYLFAISYSPVRLPWLRMIPNPSSVEAFHEAFDTGLRQHYV